MVHSQIGNPAWTAGSKHWHLLVIRQALQQFCSFLHNGYICRKNCIQHIVKAHALQGCHQTALSINAWLHILALQPCCADSRSYLHHSNLVRICQNIIYLWQIISFLQGTSRTMGDTLTTKGAFGIGNRNIIHSADIGIGTGILYIPNITALYLAANLETAHTFYTLLGIPNQRKIIVPGLLCYMALKGQIINAQMTSQGLQRTVTRADTGSAETVMLRKNQLHIGLADTSYLGGVGKNNHALAYGSGTGCYQLVLPQNLHHANLAGGNFIDSL